MRRFAVQSTANSNIAKRKRNQTCSDLKLRIKQLPCINIVPEAIQQSRIEPVRRPVDTIELKFEGTCKSTPCSGHICPTMFSSASFYYSVCICPTGKYSMTQIAPCDCDQMDHRIKQLTYTFTLIPAQKVDFLVLNSSSLHSILAIQKLYHFPNRIADGAIIPVRVGRINMQCIA